MEGFFEALGTVGFVFLVIVGLAAGWIASMMAGGRHRVRYLVVGVLAALATPFILAAVGVGILAAGGLLAILLVAAAGAIVVLLIVRAVTDRR